MQVSEAASAYLKWRKMATVAPLRCLQARPADRKVGQSPFAALFVRFACVTVVHTFPCSMPPKRKSYTAKFKRAVVNYAEQHGNRAAGRHFDMTEKMVRTWRQSADELQAMKSSKRADCGKKARWPELEGRLHTWVLEQRAQGRALSTVQLRLKAQTLAKEMGAVGFVGGPSWCSRFMRHKALAIRARTSMCQNLPQDFREKVEKFLFFTKKEIESNGITDSHILNMDEVPLTFDIPMERSVATKGDKVITIATTGHEKAHFTVVLACSADGKKKSSRQ